MKIFTRPFRVLFHSAWTRIAQELIVTSVVVTCPVATKASSLGAQPFGTCKVLQLSWIIGVAVDTLNWPGRVTWQVTTTTHSNIVIRD